MLNFAKTNIVFGVLLVVLIASHLYSGMPFWAYLLLIFVYSLVVFYGCYYVGSDFFVRIVCSANTTEKEIAISFDDGPAQQFTPEILDILKAENIPVAFFCIGKRIAGNESLLQRVYNEGHLIGNHSYSHHTWFDLFSAKKMLADLRQMDAAMNDVLGVRPRLFRPPYGVTNPNLARAIRKGSYTPVGWSVRSYDTVIKDDKKLLERVCRGIRPGAIFLFHDTCASTKAALPLFIQTVKERGYRITRLDKMLNLPAYA